MRYILSLVLLLSILWLVLSTHFTPLMLSFGAISIVFTVVMARRLKVDDKDGTPLHIMLFLPRYWIVLLGKIFSANLDVLMRIWGFKPISPTVISIPLDVGDDLYKTIYANSITLTPGTSSVYIENGHLIVHCISEEGAKELLDGDMKTLLALLPPSRSSLENS